MVITGEMKNGYFLHLPSSGKSNLAIAEKYPYT